MAEIIQKDGTWTFDGDTVRIVPGRDKGVGALRQTLGEVAVPLRAIGGISHEPGRKAGRLRLRLRDGACPLLQVTAGRLPEASDPYRLTVDNDRTGVAEYFVDEVRNALLLDRIDPGPAHGYLLPGPSVPLTVSAGDGTAEFDGDRITLNWSWTAEEAKTASGPRSFRVAELGGVQWFPARGLENGWLRFSLAGAPQPGPPKYDPYTVELFGLRKDPVMALVAAAVAVRMPHPTPATPHPTPAAPLPASAPTPLERSGPALAGEAADHDTLLRRLRELGELRQGGILTEAEFSAAKAAILGRF
ncbi:DUF4429 domain-containing protein [Streptomyces sp. NPDC048606]|uniref:DUF4429 domain-containing protein n=1 Tax=Streptomyces sp. NPDC048606 TaxID=3154726 RepID=UPI0034442892